MRARGEFTGAHGEMNDVTKPDSRNAIARSARGASQRGSTT
jgi:hypothetical protein